MKKTSKIICLICAVVLLAILFVPFSVNYYEDGVMLYMETYENTCVYLFPNNFKDVDELWDVRH